MAEIRIAFRRSSKQVTVETRRNLFVGEALSIFGVTRNQNFLNHAQKTIPKLKVSPPERVTDTTIHNPYRNVGRNDPCPCGSGKKFKKCCLEKVR